MSSHKYNEDYFENGVAKGLSGYQNFTWMPTRSISEAVAICNKIEFQEAIDYGCAKGFLVKALRLLGKSVIGLDVSKYAVGNALPEVKKHVFHIASHKDILKYKTELLLGKDVLEHVEEAVVPELLDIFSKMCTKAFFVIPLGDNDRFRIREYEIDHTHVTRKDEEWWINQFLRAGFKLEKFDYSFGYLKEKWTKNDNRFGNGFFYLTKKTRRKARP
ncbi:MAG: hypothetical protein PHV36_01985 [Elusimicrobiales bacterium]|nr:hypothetical protein [Elusimicrobiales bacterium]